MVAVQTHDRPVLDQLRSTPRPASQDGSVTFWENVAQTRWGHYVTAIEREAILAAAASFTAPGAGLEVGCDGGRWCRLLSDRGWKMTATDTNRFALDICQQRDPSVTCLHVRPDDDYLPVGTDTIDLLICVEVPVMTRSWFVREAQRVLKPGGVFVGVLANRCSWRGLLNHRFTRHLADPPLYRTSYAAYRSALRTQGFEIRSQRGCCWPPFARKSNSTLIPLATAIERFSGLQHITALSPWVVFTAVLR